MKCVKCGNKAVHNDLCKEHFVEYYEAKVKNTVRNFSLIKDQDNVLVATSGGKDSLCALYIIKKIIGKATALAIDEGICGYREHTLADLKFFCDENGIKLNVHSFKDEFGLDLDEMCRKLKVKPCTICGVFRRYMLNKYSKGFDVVATGHNLDDECQSIVMNYLRFNLELMARLGPKTGMISSDKFVPRVKPLYFCTEKENVVYSLINGFKVSFAECPYAVESYRATVRDELNLLENKNKGSKKNIVDGFISAMPLFKEFFMTSEPVKLCDICGEPSKTKFCKACSLLNNLKFK